jgi:Uma2 family endonuclease
MAAPVKHEFDPLRDLDGVWTTVLAEQYLPLPGVPKVKYECWDGRLYMSPTEASPNSWGKVELAALMREPARRAGLYVYGTISLAFGPQSWIEPDVTILYRVPRPEDRIWVPVDHCVMPVEVVSPSSRRRDMIDKPAGCAAAGIPYFMRVELEPTLRHVDVVLMKLDNGKYKVESAAPSGQKFATTEPFVLSFDPAVLLEP